MPHFRVDDALHSHPKAQRAGDDALGMWSRAGSFCMAYLTDGFVPEWWVKQQPKGTVKAKRLVDAGLWHAGAEREGEKGWQFHEFTGPGRQDSRAQIEAEREKWRKKKAAQRGDSPQESPPVSPRVSQGVSPGDTSGDSPRESLHVTRDPTQPNPKELSGYVFESATDPTGRTGTAATIGAELVAQAQLPDSLPAETLARLRTKATDLVKAGSSTHDVTEALRLYGSKTGVSPGILPDLVADVVKLRNGHAMAGTSANGKQSPSKRKVGVALGLADKFANQPPEQSALEAR